MIKIKTKIMGKMYFFFRWHSTSKTYPKRRLKNNMITCNIDQHQYLTLYLICCGLNYKAKLNNRSKQWKWNNDTFLPEQ